MTKDSRKSSGLWAWIILGFFVALIAVATLYYIGWFDNNSHVDTPAGDNVKEQYEISEADAGAPGVAEWQNAEHESLREVVAEPEVPTETPPSK